MEQAATSELMPRIDRRPAAVTAEFEALVEAYKSKIFRFVLASLRDRDAAESVTQDCFFKAYKAWDRFRNDCSLDTWLMQIAVNLVRDHIRNRRFQFWRRTGINSQPADQMGDWLTSQGSSPESQALTRERVHAVWEAAGQLSERQRTVFLLRFVEDMDLLEIAAATGMQEGTVKVHLHRALQAIRKRIGKENG